jgi:hypothetical protein
MAHQCVPDHLNEKPKSRMERRCAAKSRTQLLRKLSNSSHSNRFLGKLSSREDEQAQTGNVKLTPIDAMYGRRDGRGSIATFDIDITVFAERRCRTSRPHMLHTENSPAGIYQLWRAEWRLTGTRNIALCISPKRENILAECRE